MSTVDELRERRASLKAMTQTLGWGVLTELVGEQVRLRETIILTEESGGLDDLLVGVRMKGERLGMKLVVGLPEAMIESLEADIVEAVIEEEGEK